jgi:NADH dehydrogenase (ubiquinone) 1 beta subcomplex subunit 8
MLSRRLMVARPLTRALQNRTATRAFSVTAARSADVELDPNQNGGYINPPPVKRQHRDPYAGWWDEQERRNYGEPVHEDNDIMGIFATEDYRHFTPGRAWLLMGTFITTFLSVTGVIYFSYPDKPAVPRTFENGLETELGGPRALRVSPIDRSTECMLTGHRQERRARIPGSDRYE